MRHKPFHETTVDFTTPPTEEPKQHHRRWDDVPSVYDERGQGLSLSAAYSIWSAHGAQLAAAWQAPGPNPKNITIASGRVCTLKPSDLAKLEPPVGSRVIGSKLYLHD